MNNQSNSILIIDDDLGHLKSAIDYFEMEGFRILLAQDSEKGLSRARTAHPDLLLLNIVMPKTTGFELCKILKQDEATQDIPIVFLSTLSTPEDKINAFALGGVDYISKPAPWEEVVARVMLHLRTRKIAQKLQAELQELQKQVNGRLPEIQEQNKSLHRIIANQAETIQALHNTEQKWRHLSEKLLADQNSVISNAGGPSLPQHRDQLRAI